MVPVAELPSRFLAWWSGELAACMPAGLRRRLRRQRCALIVEPAGEVATLWLRQGGERRPLGQVALDRPDPGAARRAFLEASRAMPKRRAEVVVALPADRVLRRVIELPAAAAENLREVLSFEMDRHTPFRADEVAFDYRVAGIDAAAKRLRVALAVVPRGLVDEALRAAARLGVRPDRVAPAGEDEDAGMNLLAPEAARRGPLGRRLSATLAVACVLLAAGAVAVPLIRQQEALAAYQAAIAEARSQAVAADALKQRLASTLERSRFLVERRRSIPTVAELLREVTERLPDNSWLMQLRLAGDRVTLSGFSPSAASLVALLEDSPLLAEVRFASPVIVDPRSGLERFNFAAVASSMPGD
jgi:general secretion pathway protein L